MSARRWLPPAVWAAFILLLTSIPAPPDELSGIPHGDKLVHILLYAGLGWLVTRALRAPRPLSLAAALLGIAVFGAVDEWHQQFLARDADLVDWLADMVGATVGIAAGSWLRSAEAAQ